MYKDTEGRILITEVTVGNEKLMVANIYAPLENKGNFFVIINDILTDYNKGNVIVAGDFNAVVKPSRDRKSVKPIKHNQGKLPISGFEMMKEQELIDVWPKLYQQKSGFTFFSECHKSHSRIDLFLISRELINTVEKMEISPRTLSDHNLIELYLQVKQKTQYDWKLREDLLNDENFVNKMKKEMRFFLKKMISMIC